MKHYAGLDVSVEERLCIVDEAGNICRELKVASHPDDLARLLADPAWRFARGGLEAGPLSQADRGWPAGGLYRDPAHQGILQSASEQERPQ